MNESMLNIYDTVDSALDAINSLPEGDRKFVFGEIDISDGSDKYCGLFYNSLPFTKYIFVQKFAKPDHETPLVVLEGDNKNEMLTFLDECHPYHGQSKIDLLELVNSLDL